jgi:hypothetical protein
MSHEWTMKFIEHRAADRRMLRLPVVGDDCGHAAGGHSRLRGVSFGANENALRIFLMRRGLPSRRQSPETGENSLSTLAIPSGGPETALLETEVQASSWTTSKEITGAKGVYRS